MTDRQVDYLLIGGGLACATAAQTLRERGADGEIMLVGREPDPPYNRPPCSKGYLQGRETREQTFVQSGDWYQQNSIQLLTRTSVMKLDVAARQATLSNKQTISFNRALIATGANVRRLNVEGCELEGIHYLRALGNADAIRADAAGKRVVLIGGSYIGCEVAASLTAADHATCEIVMQEQLTLQRGFGETAARFFQDRLQENGVAVHGEDELERFEGSDGRVTHVITKRGLRLEADAVVIGAGVTPDVMLGRSAGIEIDPEHGGLLCDSRLRTSAPDVYAAGDVASYHSVPNGRRLRVEHWDVALSHGKTAAANMLGDDMDHDVVPYFFSDLADWSSLEYVGPAKNWDQEIVRGSIDEGTFSIFYLNQGQVQAALSVGRVDDLEHARRLIVSAVALDEMGYAQLADVDSDLGTLS